MDIRRIRKLAGLTEGVMTPEEQDRMDDERRAREAKVEKAIQIAFSKSNITIAEDGIFYDELSDREAIVRLENSVSIEMLNRLVASGIGSNFKIDALSYELEITFTVAPYIDSAHLT